MTNSFSYMLGMLIHAVVHAKRKAQLLRQGQPKCPLQSIELFVRCPGIESLARIIALIRDKIACNACLLDHAPRFNDIFLVTHSEAHKDVHSVAVLLLR